LFRRKAALLAVMLGALCATGCRQDMHNQPRYKTFAATEFFGDGRSERPSIDDTVARGQLHLNDARYTGKVNGKDIDYYPIQITRADLTRGRERFDIYCSPCHGRVGDGRGMVVLRGFKQPPSYYEPQLMTAPAGHFFDVMTNGFGAMFSYASRVPVDDRWRIAAYIRALQLSQNAPPNLANVGQTRTNGARMQRAPQREQMGGPTGGGLK
jgi:cytochrome c553